MEAVDAGIKFISVFTERIPRGDVCQMLEYAKQRGARIVGPNSLGMASPGKGKLGAIGGPAEEFKKAYLPGNVAILSRSGGMLTETASLLAHERDRHQHRHQHRRRPRDRVHLHGAAAAARGRRADEGYRAVLRARHLLRRSDCPSG